MLFWSFWEGLRSGSPISTSLGFSAASDALKSQLQRRVRLPVWCPGCVALVVLESGNLLGMVATSCILHYSSRLRRINCRCISFHFTPSDCCGSRGSPTWADSSPSSRACQPISGAYPETLSFPLMRRRLVLHASGSHRLRCILQAECTEMSPNWIAALLHTPAKSAR